MTKVEASNHYFIQAWKFFSERFPGGEVHGFPGLLAAFCGVPIPFLNACFLDSPAESELEFEMRVGRAVGYATQANVPWFLILCDAWVPEKTEGICRGHGLERMLTLDAMVASSLAAPRRPLPELRYERADRAELCDLLGWINSRAYGLPDEVGKSISAPSVWDDQTYPVIGFAGGEPVSCAATILVERILYVGWVATLPEHQRKGYADAVMRKSLEMASADTGISETWLHATEAGFPVYKAMGYEAAARFSLYSPAAGDASSSH